MDREIMTINTKRSKISTIGDSLTEGNGRDTIFGEKFIAPGMYQSWMFNWLLDHGIKTEIINLGIGGQIINQICGRFEQTVPADIIVSMGGTNDCWRFANSAPNIEEEMAEDILEEYQIAIKKAIQKQISMKQTKPIIIIAAIPPVGKVSTIPTNMKTAILYINQKLKNFVDQQADPMMYYCDVFNAMANEDQDMRVGLYVPDGVHFTIAGNQTCGEVIARSIQIILNEK
jgi:lysophospholipase L1-like esterase